MAAVHNIAAVQAAVPVHNVPAVQSVTPIQNVAAVHDVAPVHHVAAVHAATPVQNVAAVHSGIPIHTVAGVNAVAPFNHVSGVPVHHGYNNANTQVSPSASLSIAGAAPAAVPGVVGARIYAGAGRYVANSAGTVHVAKREADPYYAGYAGLGYTGYGGYGGYGLGYGGHIGYAGYGGYGHGYGVVNHPVHHNVANTQVSPSASLSIAGAAPAAVPGVVGARTYAGAGRYVANSAGTVHVA